MRDFTRLRITPSIAGAIAMNMALVTASGAAAMLQPRFVTFPNRVLLLQLNAVLQLVLMSGIERVLLQQLLVMFGDVVAVNGVR